MQQDAEECFSLLLQSMKDVPGKQSSDLVSDLFEGEFTTSFVLSYHVFFYIHSHSLF